MRFQALGTLVAAEVRPAWRSSATGSYRLALFLDYELHPFLTTHLTMFYLAAHALQLTSQAESNPVMTSSTKLRFYLMHIVLERGLSTVQRAQK
jgi:hypothetical protein